MNVLFGLNIRVQNVLLNDCLFVCLFFICVKTFQQTIECTKKVEEAIKCEADRAFYSVFTTKLINSIIQKQEC